MSISDLHLSSSVELHPIEAESIHLELADTADRMVRVRPRRSSAAHQVTVLFWRVFDFIGASLILILLLPLIGIIAAWIALTEPGPVLFRHRRIGHQGLYFHCLKFRTMRAHCPTEFHRHLDSCPKIRAEWNATFKLRKDPRITKIGSFLRKTSLDELPQLLNVLRGEMSLVGPRPIVDAEVERYGPFFSDYCSVRPGLTGLWQVSGRSDTSYKERVSLDCEYINKKSILYDSVLIIKTVPALMISRGAY